MSICAYFMWLVLAVAGGGFALAAADLFRGWRADRQEARR